MKRSRSIRLLLLGGLSAGALTGCGSGSSSQAPITSECFYTNNYFVPGVGYYHAPFRAWYALPYNHFDQQKRSYFFGGLWAAMPHESITNISSPRPETAQSAQAQRTDIVRGGFGSFGHSHGIIA
jgi:hypothetical protein